MPCSVGWGSGVAVSCGVGHGSDLTLLWLWCRLVATALNRPLAWEPPYAVGVAIEKEKKKKLGRHRAGKGAPDLRAVTSPQRGWQWAEAPGDPP